MKVEYVTSRHRGVSLYIETDTGFYAENEYYKTELEARQAMIQHLEEAIKLMKGLK